MLCSLMTNPSSIDGFNWKAKGQTPDLLRNCVDYSNSRYSICEAPPAVISRHSVSDQSNEVFLSFLVGRSKNQLCGVFAFASSPKTLCSLILVLDPLALTLMTAFDLYRFNISMRHIKDQDFNLSQSTSDPELLVFADPGLHVGKCETPISVFDLCIIFKILPKIYALLTLHQVGKSNPTMLLQRSIRYSLVGALMNIGLSRPQG